MPRADKVAEVSRLAEAFRSCDAVVLTEYRGLSMAELSELRRSLGQDVSYTIVKNTLAKRAADEAGATVLVEELQGPSALAFVTGDPVEAAKALRDFSKAHSALVLRAGLLSGRFLDAAEVTKLADLESREVLLARLAGAMKASMNQAVSLFAAPLSQTARAVDALRARVAETAEGEVASEGAAAEDEVASDGVVAAAEDEVASDGVVAAAEDEVASDGVDRREPAEDATLADATLAHATSSDTASAEATHDPEPDEATTN